MSILSDNPSIIISEPKKASYICYSDRYWPVGDGFYFFSQFLSYSWKPHAPSNLRLLLNNSHFLGFN